MSGSWPATEINDILKRDTHTVEIEPNKEYREITVKLWGKGVVLRRVVSGTKISGNRRFVAKSGQFVLSRIDARNGAFGIVPKELDGAVVTNDFPLFNLERTLINPDYLNWLSKTNAFIELCKRASEGTTNRVRLQEERFLSSMINLPPLVEQRRIVARIEELVTKIRQALSLRQDTVDESGALLDSVIDATFTKMESVERKPLAVLTSKIGSGSTPRGGRAFYPSSGVPFIRSMNVRMRQFQWDGIVFIDKATHEAMKGTQVRPNDVLLNITGASIGRVACAPTELAEANVNQHVTIIRPLEALNPRYLMYWISQPAVQEFINEEQKGATRQGFTKEQIEALQIPLLPLAEQENIVSFFDTLQAKVNMLKELQTQTIVELEALRPSIFDKAFRGEL